MQEKRGSSTRRRPSFGISVLFTYSTNMAVAFLSLANVLIVSRSLGPTGRGDVVFLTAIAWLTSSLATLGVEEANANLAASHPPMRRSLATNSLFFAAIFGVGAAVTLTLWVLIHTVVYQVSDTPKNREWMTFLWNICSGN